MRQFLGIRHRVQDYRKWKRAFDKEEELREAYGLRGGDVCRDMNDPLELTIMLECEDVGSAKEFMRSQEHREAMRKAGVVGKPDTFFVEEVERVLERFAQPEPAEVTWGESNCEDG